ncbi:TELO2-interacting protein 1 homolog [Plutella xylostella]|uniref:TELO2-interacting protein 1 homolog n=1 Tax=Plutella xylostella TaxID=51655 RepID=UPI002032C57F|nr:TELO2-interacting protein 1 homolog [Plutella xylostella]
MNPNLKQAFARIKPLCDSLLISPNPEIINMVNSCVMELKSDTLQEMQLYILFPVASHLKSKELKTKHEVQRQLVDTMNIVLEKVSVHLPDVFVKYHTCLLNLVFDKGNPGMVAKVSEELLLSVMKCMTTLMMRANGSTRLTIFKSHVPLLAQTIYIAAHIAKLEKLRSLRLAAIGCLTAYTATHPTLCSGPGAAALRTAAADMAGGILPGVVAALQEVSVDADNPGHALVVAALNAMHNIVCMVVNDKISGQKDNVSIEDFNHILTVKDAEKKDVAKRPAMKTPEWYSRVAIKLELVTRTLVPLQSHSHFAVRMELAVYCSKLLLECSQTMAPSIPHVLDVLIALAKDEYPEISRFCSDGLQAYFCNISHEAKLKTLDIVAENFISILQSLPRILNNVDTPRKLATLNLIHGYLQLLGSSARLASVLGLHRAVHALTRSLVQAAARAPPAAPPPAPPGIPIAISTIDSEKLSGSPWRKLKHIDDPQCETRLIEICRLIGNSECADIIVDELLDLVPDSLDERIESVYLCNWIGSAPHVDTRLTKRIIDKYIEPHIWYLPLDMLSEAPPLTDETYDVSIYNPRAWEKDSVPGLYEGTIEMRYTDIGYSMPRTRPKDPNYCTSLAEAQNNTVLTCMLTEGLGILAKRLMADFQPYLLKTLCLILERVGSKYWLVQLAGARALGAVTAARAHGSVTELVQENADYFTHQVTVRLKKAWNTQSALQILTVVMEYSDASILNCLHGIISDVLVQSCDKYHENDLHAYLHVFLTFVTRTQAWFPPDPDVNNDVKQNTVDVTKDLLEYVENLEESERLLNEEEGKSGEELYKEDLKAKEEEDVLNYDDTVTEEKKPLPQHITLTLTILKRCLNFIPSRKRDERLMALQIINHGLLILQGYESEMLPLVHLVWSPMVVRFEESDAIVLRATFELLVTMAKVSKDFIRSRTVKDVLPKLYKLLRKSAQDSHLKDVGSYYRQSQAYRLQVIILTALPRLVKDLRLEDGDLEECMSCVELYLSNKQPKPLQNHAVTFFKEMLQYDHGAAWHHLRTLCKNQHVLQIPHIKDFKLNAITGSPYKATDKTYANNIKSIFELV